MGSCPRLHGGISAVTMEGRVPARDAPTEMPGGRGGVRDWRRDSAARLCCAQDDMLVGGRGWVPAPVFTGAGSSRE